MTAKAFFERLYSVLGLTPIYAHCHHARGTHTGPHRALDNYFSISVQFFPRVAPQFLCQHESPGNLAESRYPRAGPLAES